MSPDASTRIGIIGTGNIGRAYAMAIGSSTSVSLAAVCDTDEGQRYALASTTGAIGFASHIALAESGACGAVIVATPPATHAEISVDCIERGLDVLCEKPFTLDGRTARAMFDVASRANRMLAMASKFRYVSDIAQARSLIQTGLIGMPTMIDVTFAGHVDMSDRWNSDATISGGGVLIDNGTHAVDIIRYLVGPIRRVSAMRGRSDRPGGVEDTGIILAETDGHTIASAAVSWSISPHNEAYVVVHGTEGTIMVGWAGSFHRGAAGGAWTPFGSGYSKMDALRLNVENFAAAASGREFLRIDTADVVASVSVIEGAYRAINSGKWIAIDEADWPAANGQIVEASGAG